MGSAQGPVTSELEQARTEPEFGAHTPLAEKLLAVAIRAQNFTGSSGVAIALTEGHEMVCRASWGTSAPDVGARLSIEHSFTGLCVRTGEPLRCDDAQSDPRVDPEACQALGISAIAVAPVRRGLTVVGVIAAFSDTPNAFTDKHLLILTTLSEVIVELLDESQPTTSPAQAIEGSTSAERAAAAPGVPKPSPPLGRVAAAPDSILSAARFEAGSPAPVASGTAAKPALAVPQPPRAAAAPSKASAHSAPHDNAADLFEVPRKKDETLPAPLNRGPAPQASKTGAPSSVRLVPLKQSAPAPDFAPELTFGGYEAETGAHRRWMLPAAVLAIFAVIAVAGWRWHVARSAGTVKPAAGASTQSPATPPPQPLSGQEIKPSESAMAEAKGSLSPAPPITPSPSKPAAAAETPADVTVRRVPETVIEAGTPVRRPAANATPRPPQVPEALAPQLALSSPELPAILGKPAPATIAAPVSRMVPAKLVTRVPPAYPEAARRLQIAGKVVLKATITKTGAVRDIDWVSGNELFRNSAIAAVRQWRYKPAVLNGEPVESDLQIVLEFNRPTEH